MSNNNNNDPPRRQRGGSSKPKPSSKGKGPEKAEEATQWGASEDTEMFAQDPTPSTHQVPEQLSSTSTGQKRKKGLTKAQKQWRDEQAEDAYNDALSDDSITKDMAGVPNPHAADLRQILALQKDSDSEAAETAPGADESISGAPASIRSDSPERLKPPSHLDTASTSSSSKAAGKRQWEDSPPRRRQQSRQWDHYVPPPSPPRRQSPSRRPPRRSPARPPSPRRSPPRRHSPRRSPPRPPPPSVESRVHRLERQLENAINRIHELEGANDLQWQRGYNQGRIAGFENALKYVPHMDTPSRQERDRDEQLAQDMRQAMEESRRTTYRDAPTASTPGAGPSRGRPYNLRRASPGPPPIRRISPRRNSPPRREPPPLRHTSPRPPA